MVTTSAMMPPRPEVSGGPVDSSEAEAETSQPSVIQMPSTIAAMMPPNPAAGSGTAAVAAKCSAPGCTTYAAAAATASTSSSPIRKSAVTSAVGRNPK